MSVSPQNDKNWVPDVATLDWAFRTSNEKRIKDTIRVDVQARGNGLDQSSDEYWFLVAEVAIEAVLYDLVNQAKKRGSHFPG